MRVLRIPRGRSAGRLVSSMDTFPRYQVPDRKPLVQEGDIVMHPSNHAVTRKFLSTIRRASRSSARGRLTAMLALVGFAAVAPVPQVLASDALERLRHKSESLEFSNGLIRKNLAPQVRI